LKKYGKFGGLDVAGPNLEPQGEGRGETSAKRSKMRFKCLICHTGL
jgi:hypothetical protein